MDPSQPSPLLQTPRQPKHGEQGEERTSTARRPRNREVTSRYKISTPTNPSSAALSSSCRFPTPNGERTTANVSDLPSPRRFQSAERRRPSPSRIVDTKVSISGHSSSSSSSGLSSSNVSSTYHIPKLSSTRGFSPSLHCDLPLPSIPPKRIHSVNRSKDSGHQVVDHTLKPSANTAHRKLILEHRITPSGMEDSDQTENSQPLDNINRPDHRRWTGGNGKMFGAALSRSVDFSAERLKQPNKMAPSLIQPKPCYGSSRAPRPINTSRAFAQPANEVQNICNGFSQSKENTESKDAKDDMSAKVSKKLQEAVQISATFSSMEHTQADQVESLRPRLADSSVDSTDESIIFPIPDDISEADSMSSVVTIATASSSRGTSAARSVRGTTVPARFLQDTMARSTRSSQSSMNSLRSSMAEPDLAMTSARRGGVKSNLMAPMTPDHVLPVSDLVVSGVALSPWAGPANRSLPTQQQSRVSPFRHSTSPSKSRTHVPVPSLAQNHHHQRSSNTAVMLTFGGVETSRRSGRKGMSQVEETHQYRMLQNRLLQWHFVNAKAEATMKAQSCAAEKSLYNVCAKTFELQESIAKKRTLLQQARQAQQLKELLSAQLPLLEDWSCIEQQHTIALDGTIQALNSAVLRIPFSGVKVDIHAVKDALESAVEMMNCMENSVNFLLPKAEQTNALMSELAHCVTQERLLLEECSELLKQTSTLEVEECSLRAQLMQMEREKAAALVELMDSSTV